MVVCIYFLGVFFEFYICLGFSYIVSVIGNFLYMDSMIVDCMCFFYVKFCIEVFIMVVIFCFVNVELLDGLIVFIVVFVFWFLIYCLDCYFFDYFVSFVLKSFLFL